MSGHVLVFITLMATSSASARNYCGEPVVRDGYVSSAVSKNIYGTHTPQVNGPGDPFSRNQPRYAIKPVDFNSAGTDFSPYEFNHGIVFVSSRSKKGDVQAGENSFLNLFHTVEMADGSFTEPKALNESNISAYHEGPVAFYEKGSKMIFTRNAFVKKSKLRDGSVTPLELARSQMTVDSKWSEPVPLVFASSEYSVAHPAINEAGTTLYFSSNMPGTLGQSDLFVAHFRNGAWTKPENLGAAVNTGGQEMFPFVYKDSLLFFASNGHGGEGGLDIFYFGLKDPARTIHRMEAPVNSPADDFGIFVGEGGNSGFFSSNRSGGAGEDDIYYFEEIQPFAYVQVFDSLSRGFISAAALTLHDGFRTSRRVNCDLAGKAAFRLSPVLAYNVSIDAPGYERKEIRIEPGMSKHDQNAPLRIYLQPLQSDRRGIVSAGLQTHNRTALSNVISFTSSPLDVDVSESVGVAPDDGPTEALDSASLLKVIVVEIINDLPAILIVKNDSIHVLKNASEGLLESRALNLSVEIPKGAKRHVYEEIIRKQISAQGYDIRRFLLIRSFFFDSGKTWVRNDACAQLDKIIEVMSVHRDVNLQMIFHSDSRGTEKFNLDLSKARAEEVSAYLEKGGIKKERIIAKFVGEGQLLNDCGDVADCDELLHQINRTAEFKFILQ